MKFVAVLIDQPNSLSSHGNHCPCFSRAFASVSHCPIRTIPWAVRCYEDRTGWVAVKNLFANFSNWSDENGERPGSLQKFSVALDGRGYAKERKGYIRGFVGLGLRQ